MNPQETTIIAIQGCPICDYPPTIYEDEDEGYFVVKCMNCELAVKGEDRISAIRTWNTVFERNHSELLPCPFCGSQPRYVRFDEDMEFVDPTSDDVQYLVDFEGMSIKQAMTECACFIGVTCDTCKAHIVHEGTQREPLAKAWNRRTVLSNLQYSECTEKTPKSEHCWPPQKSTPYSERTERC